MRLFGAISIRRLLRRSAIRIGYGNGLPHDATGALRLPVVGGIGGSSTPLDTTPAPLGSLMPHFSLAAGLEASVLDAPEWAAAAERMIASARPDSRDWRC